MKKVTVIGGGTGTYQVLTGLKRYPVELSAVVSMCDSGGSTGKLRKELGILPPGDVRRAILALSDLPFAQNTLEEIFDFRFSNGDSLEGHSLGNILLAALVQITGSMDKAINEAARILNASGSVYPVTLDNTNLVAVLKDGTKVVGETNIDRRDFKLDIPINDVLLEPGATVYRQAAKAIEESDIIVLGPGDLYTSIIPTLLVKGVNDAIQESDAKFVYVVNLMTKLAETYEYKASDFVNEVKRYLGDASERLGFVLVNEKVKPTKKIKDWYEQSGQRPVENDLPENGDIKVIIGNYMDNTELVRHDPEALAKAIMALL